MACTKYLTCDLGEVSVEQLLMSLFAVNDDGDCVYIRTVSTSVDCDELSDAFGCDDGQIDLATLLKQVIVVDPCSGKPALNLALCTC